MRRKEFNHFGSIPQLRLILWKRQRRERERESARLKMPLSLFRRRVFEMQTQEISSTCIPIELEKILAGQS